MRFGMFFAYLVVMRYPSSFGAIQGLSSLGFGQLRLMAEQLRLRTFGGHTSTTTIIVSMVSCMDVFRGTVSSVSFT